MKGRAERACPGCAFRNVEQGNGENRSVSPCWHLQSVTGTRSCAIPELSVPTAFYCLTTFVHHPLFLLILSLFFLSQSCTWSLCSCLYLLDCPRDCPMQGGIKLVVFLCFVCFCFSLSLCLRMAPALSAARNPPLPQPWPPALLACPPTMEMTVTASAVLHGPKLPPVQ